MKSRVGLAISVGLNLGLVGAFTWLWFHPPTNGGTAGGAPVVIDLGTNEDGSRKEIQLAYPSRPNFKFPTNILSYVSWRSIESPDYRQYVANLRALRCPEETIRDIIVADINDLYAAKWRELLNEEAESFKYWQTGEGLPGLPSDMAMQQAREFDRERRELIRELLEFEVTDSVMDFAAINPLELTLVFLPEERRRQVIAVQEQFARDQAALLGSLQETGDLEVQLAALRDVYNEQLDDLLTPEERLRFEMTTSPLATALRMELAGFEPSEEEFQRIYEARLQEQQNAEMAQLAVALAAADELDTQLRLEAQQNEALAAQDGLLGQLGEQRYADYMRTQDPTYQTLIRSSLVNRVHPAVANRIYELQQVAMLESEKVRANSGFSVDQQQAALVGIATETERTIREELGDPALRVFHTWQGELSR